MTKIKFEVELEFPDDHKFGVSEERDGDRVLTKETIAAMVRENFWSLLNTALCEHLMKRVRIEANHGTGKMDKAMYDAVVRWNDADQDVWRQMTEKGKISVIYESAVKA